jgi:hypothetical protein
VKQRFAKHFENRNLKPTRVEDPGYIEPKDLYYERIKILNR